MRIQLEAGSRYDFALTYETTEVFVAPTSTCRVLKSKASWGKAAKSGEIIRFSLPEEDEIVGRVVLGELTDDEEAQWVAESVTAIELSDGACVIDGSPYLCSQEFRDWQVHAGYQLFDLPPGFYRLRILTYLNSGRGEDRLRLPSGDGYWNYFKASHPDRKVPEWVADLAENNDEDIPEDAVWDPTPAHSLVDFLFQFTPGDSDASLNNLESDGSLTDRIRKPDPFPLGIPTHSINTYLREKQTLLEPLERAAGERIQAEDAAHDARKAAKKADEQSIAALFSDEVEWFREKQFDKLLPRVTAGLAAGFVAYCETQLKAFREHEFEVDPINPLSEHGPRTCAAELDLWQLDDDFSPPNIVDLAAADAASSLLELHWNYCDPSVTDIFNLKHKVSVQFLLAEDGDGWKITGIQWDPMI